MDHRMSLCYEIWNPFFSYALWTDIICQTIRDFNITAEINAFTGLNNYYENLRGLPNLALKGERRGNALLALASLYEKEKKYVEAYSLISKVQKYSLEIYHELFAKFLANGPFSYKMILKLEDLNLEKKYLVDVYLMTGDILFERKAFRESSFSYQLK